MNTVLIGLTVVVIAAVLQGSFAVPMSYARKWKWENSWLLFSIFGMVVFNIILAWASIPSLIDIYRASSAPDILMPVLWGIVWGLGAIGFGLGITSAGLALGYAVLLGTVLSMGTFIPMAALYPTEIFTTKGYIVITGLIITLAGIVTSGYAGILRDRQQGSSSGEITKAGRFSVKTGIFICFAAGVFSSVINIGFSLSRTIIDTALSFGAPDVWAGNTIWALMFSSGAVINIAYCVYLMKKNGTASLYRIEGSGKNTLLLMLMSLMWIGSFILYGVGARMMGSWGAVIGWSVYMTLSIAVGTLWGIIQGEWRNASLQSRRLMAVGLAVIFVSIAVFAFGSMS